MKGGRNLKSIKEKGTNKLIILGYDINWFCNLEKLTDCTPDKYRLLTYYKFSTDAKTQYLYLLK
jgi:hypothetical protein